MTSNPLIAWLKESILRLSTKSPKFFKIWQLISGALVIITGLPDALHLMNIQIPDVWDESVTKAVAWASRGIFLMSMMTTQSTPVAIDQNGTPIKKTNEAKLPFTAIQEKKEIAKEDAKPDTPDVAKVVIPETPKK